jgi:hypothetical protein
MGRTNDVRTTHRGAGDRRSSRRDGEKVLGHGSTRWFYVLRNESRSAPRGGNTRVAVREPGLKRERWTGEKSRSLGGVSF